MARTELPPEASVVILLKDEATCPGQRRVRIPYTQEQQRKRDEPHANWVDEDGQPAKPFPMIGRVALNAHVGSQPTASALKVITREALKGHRVHERV